MSILIYALIVILIAGLIIWLLKLLPLDGNLQVIAQVIIILIAVLVIAERAGLV